jgi:PKD repeat protein
MSSPHVAAVAGLVRSKNPELEKEKVDSVIKATADPIDHLNPAYAGKLGSGRLNAAAALAGTPIADFYADVTFGQAPLAVNFFDNSYLNPVTWTWNLGNGEMPTTQNASTVYPSAGLYTVSLTAQTDAGAQTTSRADFIRVIEDSVGGEVAEVIVNHSGSVNLALYITVPVDSITIPFAATGPATITLDTVLFDPPGAALFSSAELDSFLAGSGTGVLRLGTTGGLVLPPGVEVARFTYSVGQGTPGEALAITSTLLFPADSLAVYSSLGTYRPSVVPTLAKVAPHLKGDVNQNGFVTSADVIDMVNYIFKSGSLPDPALSDVDGTPPSTAGDIIYMINYLFKSGPPPIG